MGAAGCSARMRMRKGWESGKRGKAVVADHTPVQGGGCAKCPDTKVCARGLCQKCYQREYRKEK
jgi:hypothetical protein